MDVPYEPFTPDIVVREEMDLAPFGIAGARIVPMPGHTLGSLAVRVGEDDALVGDQLLGGLSVLDEGQASESYFQANAHRNHCNVLALLGGGVQRFYAGHGAPVDRIAVTGWVHDWARDAVRCDTP